MTPPAGPPGPVRTAVSVTGELLITAGALLLLFLVWQLWWTDVVAVRTQDRTTAALVERWEAPGGSGAEGVDPGADGAEVDLGALPGEAVALLRVPAFGDDWVRPVLEGTDAAVLEQGVGHYDGTAGPGEVGNFALAGHRTTYGAPFRPIAELGVGDPVVVETAEAFHVYRVSGSEVVRPRDVEVVAPVPGRPGEQPTVAVLTLTSCHPVFSARQRYVVHATLESSTPRADGPPAVLAGPVAGAP